MSTGFWPPDVEFDLEDLRTVQLLAEKQNRRAS